MARNLNNSPECGHPSTVYGGVCSTCLELVWSRASVAQENATDLQTHSRLARAMARRIRKDRHLRSSGANPLCLLDEGPPRLPRASRSLEPALPSAGRETVQECERIPVDRLPACPTSTPIYVWGCGRPASLLSQYPLRSSEAARRVAAEQGWDENDWAAWAAEFEMPQSLTEALEQLGPQLWDDPAVQGWRLQRAD